MYLLRNYPDEKVYRSTGSGFVYHPHGTGKGFFGDSGGGSRMLFFGVADGASMFPPLHLLILAALQRRIEDVLD
jgi:hypothetical protein